MAVTDRGKVVAVLGGPELLTFKKRRKRVLPQNYIAFEYPYGQPDWWYEIVEGLPAPIVNKGFIEVWDRPGLGVSFNVAAAKKLLAEEDGRFFD